MTATPDGHALNPFAVAIDSNELGHQTHYTFEGLRANADRGGLPLHVPKVYRRLDKGDYEVDGCPGFVVERKTKEDLFASLGNAKIRGESRRENFENRMRYFHSHYRTTLIVVEAELSEIRDNPPKFFDVKAQAWRTFPTVLAVNRTIESWTIRYPRVHWAFLSDRRAAEAWAFRSMEFHYRAYRESKVYRDEITSLRGRCPQDY